jgi:prevent-host-death family protein
MATIYVQGATQMERVGVRELKDKLSHYLRAVRQGQIVEVTVHGKPVARLVPAQPRAEAPESEIVEQRIWALVAEGILAWNGQRFQIPEPSAVNRGPGLLSDLVIEDRAYAVYRASE